MRAAIEPSGENFCVQEQGSPALLLVPAETASNPGLGWNSSVWCWDLRRLQVAGLRLGPHIFYDARSILGAERSLVAACRREMPSRPENAALAELEQRMGAQRRAWKAARMPGSQRSMFPDVPRELGDAYIGARLAAVLALSERLEGSRGAEEHARTWPVRLALSEIERGGIAVDEDLAARLLREGQDAGTSSCLRSILSLADGRGCVFSLMSPTGAKTGRLRVEEGFGCMSVPHGPARTAIVSRFTGGRIHTFDYNAIDYRCIVRTIGGEFERLYAGCADFHSRTAAFVYEQPDAPQRKLIKYLSYIYIYGGSDETLSDRTGLPIPDARALLEKLDGPLRPIRELRERLWRELQGAGSIVLPHGGTVEQADVTHEGMLLGLYAQSYSSRVFSDGLVRAQAALKGMKSRIIFPVHDELVVDIHPEEEEIACSVVSTAMSDGGRHQLKHRAGRDYGEATDGG